jgi:hypothetical protein
MVVVKSFEVDGEDWEELEESAREKMQNDFGNAGWDLYNTEGWDITGDVDLSGVSVMGDDGQWYDKDHR